MPRKRDRVIIDTNLLISFLINGDYTRLDRILNHKQISLLYSQELIDEFIEVAKRPKFKRYFNDNILQELLLLIAARAEFIDVSSEIDICSDPKDNFILALAKDGKATHLLTGEKVLLSLKKFSRTEIVTISDYLASI
jgi:uncharacterized protein